MDKGDLNDRLYAVLIVMGEEDEITDSTGLAWSLPHSIYDTPERSEMWAKRCVEVMKIVVVHSKPRRAIKDATTVMETILLMRGEFDLYPVDALRSY